jgi:hypothetical protein
MLLPLIYVPEGNLCIYAHRRPSMIFVIIAKLSPSFKSSLALTAELALFSFDQATPATHTHPPACERLISSISQ